MKARGQAVERQTDLSSESRPLPQSERQIGRGEQASPDWNSDWRGGDHRPYVHIVNVEFTYTTEQLVDADADSLWLWLEEKLNTMQELERLERRNDVFLISS